MTGRPDWMTPLDERILDLMAKTRRVKVDGMWLKPKAVSLNLPAENSYVGKRLRKMDDNGYVETNDGWYRITQKGVDYIQDTHP